MGRTKVITDFHTNGRGRQNRENQRNSSRRWTKPAVGGFDNGEIEPLAKECCYPLEAEINKKINWPLETLKRM